MARHLAAMLLAPGLMLCFASGCSSTEPPSDSGAGGGAGGATANGGATGSGGTDGGDTCAALAAAYAKAYQNALNCNPTLDSIQCNKLTGTALPCGNCESYVNDTTELDQIRAQYSASCPPVPCPLIACILPKPLVCLPADGGTTGRCGYPPAP